jgi:hypothetical protein
MIYKRRELNRDQSIILIIKNISSNQVKVPDDLKSFNYIDLFLLD